MIRHSFAEREVGSWLPTETAQTRSCSWRLSPEKAKCPIPPRAPASRGNMSTLCALRCLAMAGFRRGAFPGGNPWQFFHSVYPKRGLGREKRPSLAAYRRHVSKTSWLWQDMRAMYPKSPTNRLSGIRRANILPGRGPFRCTDPSNHAWRAYLAIRRRRTARAASTHGAALMAQHANLAIRRRRTALALATPAPPNSVSRQHPRRRPHGAAAFGTRHPTQRQTARALATSAPPNGAKPPATATPKRNSRANGMDWLHYVGRFCENRESEEGSGRAENADVLAKTNPKGKTES